MAADLIRIMDWISDSSRAKIAIGLICLLYVWNLVLIIYCILKGE